LRSVWEQEADFVEKPRFWLRKAKFLAVQLDELLVARGSAKLAFRRLRASSLRLTNDLA
jgi:hypothetical protein